MHVVQTQTPWHTYAPSKGIETFGFEGESIIKIPGTITGDIKPVENCIDLDNKYGIGETFVVREGCAICECSPDGKVICTRQSGCKKAIQD